MIATYFFQQLGVDISSANDGHIHVCLGQLIVVEQECGYGHGSEWWKEFVSTLRMFGYDYVLSIEHEDLLLTPLEGMRRSVDLLKRVGMPQ